MIVKAKDRSAFEVKFADQQGSDVDIALRQLEPYVLAVDLGTEVFTPFLDERKHRTNTLILWLSDDEENVAMSTVRSWVSNGNQAFKVVVKLFNGTRWGSTDAFVYTYCTLSALQHSLLTKERQFEDIQLSDNEGVELSGRIIPSGQRERSAKLLQIAFGEFEHHIMGNTQ